MAAAEHAVGKTVNLEEHGIETFCLGELRSGPHLQMLFIAVSSSVSSIAGEAPRDAPSWQSLVPRGALTRDHLIFLRRSQMFLNRPEVLYTPDIIVRRARRRSRGDTPLDAPSPWARSA